MSQLKEIIVDVSILYRPLRHERVHLPLYKVADTPFHIQGGEILSYPYYIVFLLDQNPEISTGSMSSQLFVCRSCINDL